MTTFEDWRLRLCELANGLRERTRATLLSGSDTLDRPVGRGVGDLTYGLDLPSEEWLDAWLASQARGGPLSLLTEDRGWRHRGPEGELDGFDHGGPRIAVDPIDGTRNLMADLRSAWTVIGFAPPGPTRPELADLTGGIVGEIPTTRAARLRTFAGDGERLLAEERDVATGRVVSTTEVVADDDDRVDQGYFPVFRYEPRLRPELARLEAAFFERLEREEGADLRTVYDDQYISNAGQLMLTATGVYRAFFDARALVAARASTTTTTSKPYDVAGAIVCARSAGAVVTGADGEELAFPIDAQTPVHFAAFANRGTWRRIAGHWQAVLNPDPEPDRSV